MTREEAYDKATDVLDDRYDWNDVYDLDQGLRRSIAEAVVDAVWDGIQADAAMRFL